MIFQDARHCLHEPAIGDRPALPSQMLAHLAQKPKSFTRDHIQAILHTVVLLVSINICRQWFYTFSLISNKEYK